MKLTGTDAIPCQSRSGTVVLHVSTSVLLSKSILCWLKTLIITMSDTSGG
jgi:hypothetical protein